MLYAKIVVGLPVDGPFDYLVPDSLVKVATCGKRVWVNFGPKRTIGYIVGLSAKTKIKKTKPLFDIIDSQALLSVELLKLTKELSGYYCCSWGEAIEAALPQALRKGKRLEDLPDPGQAKSSLDLAASLIFQPDSRLRREYYLQEIKKAVSDKKTVVMILADKRACSELKNEIKAKLGIDSAVLCRNEPGELGDWARVRSGKTQIVIGTRSAIFAPLENPGLVILDEEENSVYKQEQVPHYHTRKVALMRAKINGCRLILGSSSPSLESFYLAKTKKIGYECKIKKQDLPEVKIMDLSREFHRAKSERPVLSRYLSDCIATSLSANEKVLLFLNRRGFATSAACHNCKKPLVCPRCNTNLIYFYEGDILACSHCNFRLIPPKICPLCNSGYIKFKGAGTEKIESEISRIFPQVRIKSISTLEKMDLASADIFVATSAIFKQKDAKFHLVGVLGIDNALNRLDFRSAEKTFGVLQELVTITEKRMVIQTNSGQHHLFEAIAKNDPELFYNKELQERKQLGYPPYKHIILIKLRSKYPEKAQKSAEALFEKLSKVKAVGIELVSVNPSNPPKLRGNYCWQIMFKAAVPGKAVKFIKLNLKNFRHSGIIVTVDVDPV